jgi:predicted ribosome-associated RNA-binding protein Tma20
LCRKLLSDLSSLFPNASQEDWDSLLLPKKADITVHKLASSSTLIYSIANIPLFFDITGKGDFYPTIHALVKVPHLMKVLFVNSYTSHYLLAGAGIEKLGN